MKGKPLLPTLRTKKRYVVYEAVSDRELAHNDIYNSILGSFKECFGIFGLGKAGIMDTRIYNKDLKRGMIKINHNYLDQLRVALGMITKVNGNEAIMHTVGVSGIIKKAKGRYLAIKGG